MRNGEKILRYISLQHTSQTSPQVSFTIATGEYARLTLCSWGISSASPNAGALSALTLGGALIGASCTGGQPAASTPAACTPLVVELGPGSYAWGAYTGSWTASQGNVSAQGVVYRSGVA